MATTTLAAARTDPQAGPGAARFYRRMASACLAIALIGFLPSYWLPMARGTGRFPPIVHVHGALFLAWLVLFRVQTGLAAAGRIACHRHLGLCAIALAVMLPVMVVLLQSSLLPGFEAAGYREDALVFAWVNIGDMLIFTGLVGAALASLSRPEAHKRLMLAATIGLMAPPIGRWVLLALTTAGLTSGAGPLAPPPPDAAYLPHALSWLLLLVAIGHDLRIRGRPHPAYLIALALMVAQMVTLQPIGRSTLWERGAAVLWEQRR